MRSFRSKGAAPVFNNFPDILTPADVAAALGVGKNTVYKLLRERKIGSNRIGKKIIVPKLCLIDYVQSARYHISKT